MAAEAVSLTFLQCTLKGLQRSPRIVTGSLEMSRPGVFTVADISCLVIPDGCLGLPTLAALEQGITVVAVQENRNLMKNDLSALPWATGQFYQVANYWEAAELCVLESILPQYGGRWRIRVRVPCLSFRTQIGDSRGCQRIRAHRESRANLLANGRRSSG